MDPHWPALARSLDPVAASGHDVEELLGEVTTRRGLPDTNAARSLDYRLANAAPDAAAPSTGRPWASDPATPGPAGPDAPPVSPPQMRRGPAR